jgi:hypothetical protein
VILSRPRARGKGHSGTIARDVLPQAAARIAQELPDDAQVLQVAAARDLFPRADWVLDDAPHEPHGDARFTRRTWLQRDVCDRAPWPFADGRFDFAVCTQLVHVRDPVGVCAELARVARAGYVEVPAIEAELAGGTGRWLADVADAELVFTAKSAAVYADARVRVARRRLEALEPAERVLALFWEDRLPARERHVGDDELVAELAERVRTRFGASGAEVALSEARRVGGLAGEAAWRGLDALRRLR